MTDFRCIALDPPWLERGAGKCKRGADKHYPLLSPPEIIATVLGSPLWRPAPSSHLWLWATKNHLPDAFVVMAALGFRYVSSVVWVKMRANDKPAMLGALGALQGINTWGCHATARAALQRGLGQYTRGAHELLLLGVRGRAMVPAPKDRLPDVIFAERTQHSVKPAEAYDLIARVSPGPRAELFARQPREGWNCWGDDMQVEKFAPHTAAPEREGCE